MYCNYRFNMYTHVLFLLLISFCISCTQQTNQSKELVSVKDSINFYYQESIREDIDKDKKDQYLNVVYDLFVKHDVSTKQSMYILYLKALEYATKGKHADFEKANSHLLKVAKELNNTKYQAEHYRLKAYQNELKKNLGNAFSNYNEAKNLYLKSKDSIGVGECLQNMAIIQKNRNDYNGSEGTAVEALSYLENSNNKDNIASLYSVLAKNQRELLRYEEAIINYKKAISTTKNDIDRLTYKNNLAILFTDMGEYDASIKLLTEVLKNPLIQSKNLKEKARVKDNLAYTKWLKNSDSDVLEDLLDAVKLRNAQNDDLGLVASYTHLAEYYTDKDAVQVLAYGEKAIALSKKIPMPEAELDVLDFMMMAQPKNVKLRNRHIFLQDSLREVNLKVQSRFAQTKYDNIGLKKENDQKDRENERQETQKIINGVLAMLVVIIAAFIVYFLYQKHKREKILEVYNTETRISKKVHDELANDVYNVMVVLQKVLKNKAGLTSKVINQVEDIYVRTRNISHEHDSIDTGDHYTDGLREMIGDYNTDETAIIIKDIEQPNWEKTETYIKIVVYRVLQELMVNMKKHSKATVVVLTFSSKDKKLSIHYSDNGIGLPFIKASKRDLLNMENRIQSAEGTLNFDSESRKGLKLSMVFPV